MIHFLIYFHSVKIPNIFHTSKIYKIHYYILLDTSFYGDIYFRVSSSPNKSFPLVSFSFSSPDSSELPEPSAPPGLSGTARVPNTGTNDKRGTTASDPISSTPSSASISSSVEDS